MDTLYFTGHETFYCRNYWLKKGLDLLWNGKKFNEEAVVELGVGKNMVNAIRFWLKAFALVDEEEQPNELAEFIFHDEKGIDPFIEDPATIWLLHYYLVTQKRSSIYHFVFNIFRKQRIEFNEDQLITFLNRKVEESSQNIHSSSIKKDARVFLQNYLLPTKTKGIEDDFSRLLYELELVQRFHKGEERDAKNNKQPWWFRIDNKFRADLPYEVVLYCIKENPAYGNAISFRQLSSDQDSVGTVFALSDSGLMHKIEQIVKNHPKKAVFTDDGGVRVLQFKSDIDHKAILKKYYGK